MNFSRSLIRVDRVMAMIMSLTLPLCATAAKPVSVNAALKTLIEEDAPTPFLNGGLLVVNKGAQVYRIDRGMANFTTGEEIDRRSIFQTASTAKPFTAIAILQLRDAGRLRLDDAVADHLPGFPYSDITLRHLLTHTSGLPDLELFEPLVARDPALVVSSRDLIPALRAWNRPLAFRPGERHRYSNVNYQLLARVVETVARRPFGTYVRERIFRPAGMRSSYVLGTAPLTPSARPPVKNQSHVLMFETVPRDVAITTLPDRRRNGRLRYDVHSVGATVGDQNVFTTTDDLARFDRALRANRILSARSQTEAYTPVRLNDGTVYQESQVYTLYGVPCSYGMGWEVCTHPKYGRIVGHAGYNPGIQTEFYRNLDRDQVIILYDNADTIDFADRFAAIAQVLNGEPAPAVDRRRSLVRAYGDALVRGGPVAGLRYYLARKNQIKEWWENRNAMNMLGYDLLRNGHAALALEPFRLNVVANPERAGLWDSLGDGLSDNGQLAEARAAYERSLELDADRPETRAKLLKLDSPAAGSRGG